MIRKLSLLFAGALMGASAMVMVQGAPASTAFAAAGKDSDVYKDLALFGDIFERVRQQYVTPPDDKKLTESAINGMLTSLDPHSSYLNPEAAQDMRVQTKVSLAVLVLKSPWTTIWLRSLRQSMIRQPPKLVSSQAI